MGKYDAQSALALRLITAKGARTSFTRDGAITDPVTQVSVADPIAYDAQMLATPLSAGKARFVFGEGADVTRLRLSVNIALKGVTQEPRNGDRFAWGAKTYALLNVELLDPAGEGSPIMATGYAEAA